MSEQQQKEQPKQRTHEQVHEHLPEPTFQPTRTICIPIDHSESSTNTTDFVLSKIVNAKTDLVVLLNVRSPAFNDYSADLGFPYVIPAIDIDKVLELIGRTRTPRKVARITEACSLQIPALQHPRKSNFITWRSTRRIDVENRRFEA